MKFNESRLDCQISSVHLIAIGSQEFVPLGKSVRLWIRRILGPKKVKKIKSFMNDFLNWYAGIRGNPTTQSEQSIHDPILTLKPGDLVRVRSKDDIEATLNHWGQLKGCGFAPEMGKYCNTSQRVLKPVERFVDERDMRIQKTKGMVLLDGIVCQGTSSLGRCDRNCYFFWRDEWLRKIN